MINQARTYLNGALTATMLVVAAIVAFMLIVSALALRDWPAAGLSVGDSGSISVSAAEQLTTAPPARPVTSTPAVAAATPVGVAAVATPPAPAPAGASPTGARPAPTGNDNDRGSNPSPAVAGGLPRADRAPVGQRTSGGAVAEPEPSPAPAPVVATVTPPAAPGPVVSGPITPGAVTAAVKDTVSEVTDALGGAVNSGVSKVVDEVVDGVVNPELPEGGEAEPVDPGSAAGEIAGEMSEAVGGPSGEGIAELATGLPVVDPAVVDPAGAAGGNPGAEPTEAAEG